MRSAPAELPRLVDAVFAMAAAESVGWALDRFHPRAVFTTSFSAEDAVVTDLVLRACPAARIVTLDTGRLHEETHEVAAKVREHYGIAIQTFFPDRAPIERLVAEKGPFSFRESVASRKECCALRKVEPLTRALAGSELWITGLRRGQSVTRAAIDPLEWDAAFGVLKLNPLADWSEEQVWDYVRANGLPYNALHDRGFRSIGCAPCTRAVAAGEDVRAGRWWWESPEHRECGLHVPARQGGRS